MIDMEKTGDHSGNALASAEESPTIEQIEEVERAILARRSISIRGRVTAVFIFLFVLTSAMTIAALVFISEFKTRSVFLEEMANYAFEIQQARRYEKNFFLYGTDLPDALGHIESARINLEKNAAEYQSVLKVQRYSSGIAPKKWTV